MPEGAPRVLVEAAGFAVRLAEALARTGIPVPPERVGRFARALRLVPPQSRSPLYWTARVSLVSEPNQLARFDAVFAAVFDGLLDPADSRGDPNAPPAIGSEPRQQPSRPKTAPMAGTAPGRPEASPDVAGSGDVPELRTAPVVGSATERLQDTAFRDLTPDEAHEVSLLVRRLVLSTPLQRRRRTVASTRSGERVDVRRTLRVAQRTGGDPVHLVHRRSRKRPRRLVFLCDVSGSMEPYTRVFLSLLQGAVAGAHAEAFVFSTRLTRLTRQLAGRDADAALARAAAAAPDWSGGTRLAESLRRFLDDHGRRGLARGAVVVVLSDGWAQDDPELVAAQMARLRRLASRIVWVNPRKAGRGFLPRVGGMAAALPYCDAFVSGHSLAALDEVAVAIRTSRTPERKPA